MEDNDDDSNELSLPAITRKPSISFNEIVDIVKMERRGSSPGMYFSRINIMLRYTYEVYSTIIFK